jgi:LmbE family N-acetylglucosaminyl deacetylase
MSNTRPLIKNCFLFLLLSFPILGWSQMKELKLLAPTETYPKDTFLQNVSEKRAMVIVAHDDDASIMSGTIAKLHMEGWNVRLLSFCDADKDRNKRHLAAAEHITTTAGFLDVSSVDYRNDLDTTKQAYMPFPKERFDLIYDKTSARKKLIDSITVFNPTVIFTLDDQMGGYGHPDHVFISSLVAEIVKAGEVPCQHIYQGVYTNHMEQKIIEERLSVLLKKWGNYPNPYVAAKQVYGITGMPEPDVEINIEAAAELKMKYLRAYGKAERSNIRKFMPHFEDVSAEKYFKLFNREFFRVLHL